MNNSVDFSVIIPAYNEQVLIGDTLENIFLRFNEIKDLNGEIIVVDNNSTDKTSEIAKSKGAIVIFEPINQISKARNIGAGKANGRYLFFVDADTRLPKHLLSYVLDKLNTDSISGGGATLVFDNHQNKFFFGLVVPMIWKIISKTFRLAAGSFIFCRKDFFEQIGGFSENLFAGEEIHFSQQYKKICKKHRKSFRIICKFPVITSSRKISWFNPFKLLLAIFIPILFPWALKSRKMCWFWYKRPD